MLPQQQPTILPFLDYLIQQLSARVFCSVNHITLIVTALIKSYHRNCIYIDTSVYEPLQDISHLFCTRANRMNRKSRILHALSKHATQHLNLLQHFQGANWHLHHRPATLAPHLFSSNAPHCLAQSYLPCLYDWRRRQIVSVVWRCHHQCRNLVTNNYSNWHH